MPVVGVLERKGVKSHGEGEGIYRDHRRQTGRPGQVLPRSGGANILAFQSYVEERESLVRFLADDPATAKAVLGGLRMIFEETEVAVVRVANRPGGLARAAMRLGEKQINIDYSYCGSEPGSTLVLLVFDVDNLTKASTVLDELAAEDA
jgi:hypothetical protein